MEGGKGLVSVAEVLKRISREENVFCARYGGICRIPSGGNKLWDFMACADEMLYKVKGNGKNDFMVTEAIRVSI